MARSFPLDQALPGSVLFEHDAADGPAPARLTITFAATANVQAALARYIRHCTSLGYPPAATADQVMCRAPANVITINAGDGAGNTAVTIVIEEVP